MFQPQQAAELDTFSHVVLDLKSRIEERNYKISLSEMRERDQSDRSVPEWNPESSLSARAVKRYLSKSAQEERVLLVPFHKI